MPEKSGASRGKTNRQLRRRAAVLATVSIAAVPLGAFLQAPSPVSADIYWNTAVPTGGTWNTPGDWVGGVVPGSGDTARIESSNAEVVTLNTTQAVYALAIGTNISGDNTTAFNVLNQTAGNLTSDDESVGGDIRGNGWHNQSGGSNTINSYLIPGQLAGTFGEYDVSNNAVLNLTGTGSNGIGLYIGDAGTGVFNQSGGTVSVGSTTTSNLYLGYSLGAVGTVNLTGGSFNVSGNAYIGGNNGGSGGTGTFNISGNSPSFLTTASITGTLKIFSGGKVNLTGGTLSVGNLDTSSTTPAAFTNGWTAGTLNITGSQGLAINSTGPLGTTVNIPSALTLGVTNTLNLSGGTLNLNGGTVSAGTLVTSNPSQLNWTSGTLNITGPNGLTIGSGGPLGSTLNLSSGQTIVAGSGLTIAADGSLDVTTGSASFGTSALDTTIVNNGNMSIAMGASLSSLFGGFNQTSGTLNNQGTLTVAGFNFLGGSISQPITTVLLGLYPPASGLSGTFNFAPGGGGVSTNTPIPAGITLNFQSGAREFLGLSSVNNGTINIVGTGTAASPTALDINNINNQAANFTNYGIISLASGYLKQGSSNFVFTNSGILNIGVGATLDLSLCGFNQTSGTLNNQGTLTVAGFNFLGGSISQPITTVLLGLYPPASGLSGTFNFAPGGGGVSTNTPIPAGITLNFQSGAREFLGLSSVNNGTINIVGTGTAASPTALDINNINNQAANFTNYGIISLASGYLKQGSSNFVFTNSGILNIGVGATLDLSLCGFNQTSGTLNNQGTLTVAGFNFLGGSISQPITTVLLGLYPPASGLSGTFNFAPGGGGVSTNTPIPAGITLNFQSGAREFLGLSSVNNGTINIVGTGTAASPTALDINNINNQAANFTNYGIISLASGYLKQGSSNFVFTNSGILNIGVGATLDLSLCGFNQTSGTLNNQGTLTVAGFNFLGGSISQPITTVLLGLYPPASGLSGTFNFAPGGGGVSTNTPIPAGITLNFQSGAREFLGLSSVNNGTINIVGTGTAASPTALDINNINNQAANFTNYGIISLASGYLKQGSSNFVFTNSGILNIGVGATLDLSAGGFNQTSGVLRFAIGGTTQGSGYGCVVGGTAATAALGGSLTFIAGSGFTPAAGQTFQILSFPTAGSITGSFAAIQNLPGLGWDTSQLDTTGTLKLVAITSTVSSVYQNGGNGQWTTASNWTNTPATVAFPNNKGGTIYNAAINGTGASTTQVSLASSVSVNSLAMMSATLNVPAGVTLISNNINLGGLGSSPAPALMNVSSGNVLVSGLFTVNAGSTLAMSGTASISATTMNLSGATLNFSLGAPNAADFINVTGSNVQFIGVTTVNISNAGGLAAGTYPLIDYVGSLTYQGLALGTTPSGFTYSLQDNTFNDSINLIVVGPTTYASVYNTAAGSGNWNVAGNWTNTPAITAYPNNNSSANYNVSISGTSTSATQVTLPVAVSVNSLNVSSATLNIANGGSLTSGSLNLGIGGSAGGALSLVNGASLTVNGAVNVSGNAGITQLGGAFSVPSASAALDLSPASSDQTTYNMSGGSLNAAGYLFVGDAGQAVFSQTNGAVTVGTGLFLGRSTSGNGTYLLSVGTLSTPYEFIGGYGPGLLLQTSGTNTVGTLVLGAPDNLGNYQMTGGTLVAQTVQVGTTGPGASSFNSSGTAVVNITSSFTNYGTTTLGGTQNWSSGATFTNMAGTAVFNSDAGTASASTLNVIISGGSVTFASTQHLTGLKRQHGHHRPDHRRGHRASVDSVYTFARSHRDARPDRQ